MRPLLPTLRTLAVALLLPAAGAAHALPYTNLYVFGDSLSDSGRAYALANTPNPPGSPVTNAFSGEQWMPSFLGYANRFSNGPTAPEQFATMIGLSAAPVVGASGTNYAVGGATTGTGNFNFLANSPAGIQTALALQNTGLASQVTQYLLAPPGDAATALFMVQGGANDFFLASPTLATLADVQALAFASATNVADVIGRLADMGGARSFLVPNLPDIGATPLFAGNALSGPQPAGAAGVATAYSQIYNFALAQNLVALGATRPGLEIVAFDTFSAFNAVLANPAAYGFDPAKAGTSCLFDTVTPPPGPLPGQCGGYLFWDDVHPTSALHGVVAAQYVEAVPVPATVALLAIGLLGLGAAARRAARPRAALAAA
jgi:phospholipase/lecithinase/hemolysin